MAKKKSRQLPETSPMPPSTAPSPAPDTRKKPTRTGVSLHVYVEPALREAIEAAAKSHRRSLTGEVSLALEAHLRSLGLWPPADPPA
jgi:hypothetical protein